MVETGETGGDWTDWWRLERLMETGAEVYEVMYD